MTQEIELNLLSSTSSKPSPSNTISQTDNVKLTTAIKQSIWQGLPSMLGLIFQYLVEIINLIYMGHYGTKEEAGGVGISNLLVNVVCLSIAYGLNGALDTLVSQAFGHKNFHMCGDYLNRSRVILMLILIPQAGVILYTKEIMYAFGQDYSACVAAQKYSNCLLAGMVFFTQFECVRRFLQAQKIFNVTMGIQMVTMVVHLIQCHIYVVWCGMGIYGVGIATIVTFFLDFVLVMIYCQFSEKVSRTYHGFTWDAFKGWGEYLYYGVPSAVMLAAEWWSYEIITFFAGWLSVEELAAQVIILNMATAAYMFPMGLAFSSSNMVGNSIGEGHPRKAGTYISISLGLMTAINIILVICCYIFRYQLAGLYSNKPEVIEHVATVIPIWVFSMVLDNSVGSLVGSIRGLGKQIHATYLNFIAFWLINLPLVYILGFPVGLRLKGIYIGMMSGPLFQFISFTVLLCITDRAKLAREVHEKLMSKQGEVSINEHLENQSLNRSNISVR